jgi:hypothetical protein
MVNVPLIVGEGAGVIVTTAVLDAVALAPSVVITV